MQKLRKSSDAGQVARSMSRLALASHGPETVNQSTESTTKSNTDFLDKPQILPSHSTQMAISIFEEDYH